STNHTLILSRRLPTPTPSVFPYTTLFRSERRRTAPRVPGAQLPLPPSETRGHRRVAQRDCASTRRRRTPELTRNHVERLVDDLGDRKSTRLELQSRGHIVSRFLVEKKKTL